MHCTAAATHAAAHTHPDTVAASPTASRMAVRPDRSTHAAEPRVERESAADPLTSLRDQISALARNPHLRPGLRATLAGELADMLAEDLVPSALTAEQIADLVHRPCGNI